MSRTPIMISLLWNKNQNQEHQKRLGKTLKKMMKILGMKIFNILHYIEIILKQEENKS